MDEFFVVDEFREEQLREFFLAQDAKAALATTAEPAEGRPAGDAVATAAAAVVEHLRPPSCNTGGKLTGTEVVVSLGWLQGTFPRRYLVPVMQFLDGCLGASEDRRKGLGNYRESRAWASGAMLAWSVDRDEAWVIINAQSVERFGKLVELFQFLGVHMFGCTRLDATADDLGRKILDLEKIHAACLACHVPRFRRYRPDRSYDLQTGELTGDTCYLGERGKNGGGCFVRIYRKDLESGGLTDSVRAEAELSGERAARTFSEMLLQCDTDDEVGRCLGRIVAGAVDFRIRREEAHGHLSRMPRYEWWERFCDALGGPVRLKLERAKVQLQEFMDWFRTALSGKLASARVNIDQQGMDGRAVLLDWFLGVLTEGEGKEKKLDLVNPLDVARMLRGLDVQWDPV